MISDGFYKTMEIDLHKNGWPVFMQWRPPANIGLVEFGIGGERRFTTKAEMSERVRASKIAEQNANLIRKRQSRKEPAVGQIFVFFNDTDIYYGWWIYIVTLRESFSLNFKRNKEFPDVIRDIMRQNPCGLLPEIKFFDLWAKEIGKAYPHPYPKRTDKEGLKLCRVFFDEYGYLDHIESFEFSRNRNKRNLGV